MPTRRPDDPRPQVGLRPAYKRPAELDDAAQQGASPHRLDKRARISATPPRDTLLPDAAGVGPGGGPDVQQAFAAAVRRADVPTVQRTLLAGADVNRALSAHTPPALHHVVQRPACSELLGTLMAANPNVQAADNHIGPLLLAVSVGNVSAVQMLLEAGADPHHACGQVTPYLLAASMCAQSAARQQLLCAFAPYVDADKAMQVDGDPAPVGSGSGT